MNQVSFLILFNRFDVSSRTVFPLPACDRTSQGDRLSGETDGAIHVHVRATRAYVRVCGGGRALARILLPPNLSPSIPLFLFLPFFSPSASLSLSLSLHRYFRDLASALLYYYFVVISIGWLSSERRFSLQRLKSPAAVSLPRSCIAHAKILLSRRTRVAGISKTWFPRISSLDNWQSDEYYEEIVSRECDPDPGIRGGSMIFEREEGRVNGGISRQGRSESGDAAAGEGRSFPETRRSRGGEAREREGCTRLDRRLSLSNLIIILDYRGPFALVTRHRITPS